MKSRAFQPFLTHLALPKIPIRNFASTPPFKKVLMPSDNANTGNDHRYNQSSNQSKNNNSEQSKWLKFTGIVFVGHYTIRTLYDKYKEFHDKNVADLKQTRSDLEEFVTRYSLNNIDKSSKQQNDSLFLKIEKTVNEIFKELGYLEKIIDDICKTPRFINQLNHKDLVNLTYTINALSDYYINRLHDWKKAEKILRTGKNFIEEYLEKQEYIEANVRFNDLNNELKLQVLDRAKDLPKVYTTMTYLLGMTYIYRGENTEETRKEAMELLSLSKFLGESLKLFESVLSVRSAICELERIKIEECLKNNKFDEAKHSIENIIEYYKKLRVDNSDIFHRVECEEKLIKYLTKLIVISDPQEKSHYVGELSNILFKENNLLSKFSKEKSGLISKLLNPTNTLPAEKVASIYNLLGCMVITLDDATIETGDLQNLYHKIAATLRINVDTSSSTALAFKLVDLAVTKRLSEDDVRSYNSDLAEEFVISGYKSGCEVRCAGKVDLDPEH